MQGRTRTVAVAAVTCLAVALPAAAQAKTKTVHMGLPTRQDARTFQKHGSDVNDFFPHGVTIHAGDSVKFVPSGFHSVDLPKKAGRVQPLIAPTGATVSNVNDAAGMPFWFNGQPQLSFNAALGKLGFGKHFKYNGRKAVRSGVALTGAPKPMTVKFTKVGKYAYFCNVHPGMKGFVRVRPGSKRIPSAKSDKRTLANQVSRDLKVAKDLARTLPPANTVDVGAAGPHGVEFYGMFPLKPLTVHVGDSILFRMTKGSFEDHTATFAPGSPGKRSTYLGQLAAGVNANPFDPRSVYPSEDPAKPEATFTSLLHGNGFWNTGVMDRSNATPLPSANSVTFGQPGDYQFYCLIHPFMHGTIHVVP